MQAEGYLRVLGSGRTPPQRGVAGQAPWIWTTHPGSSGGPSGTIVYPASPPAHSRAWEQQKDHEKVTGGAAHPRVEASIHYSNMG